MRFDWSLLALLLVALILLASVDAQAQIYACRAPDGTRIFSDERCGPDAKVVKGIETSKRPAARAGAAARSPAPARSSADLDALLQQCDRGNVSACNEWTHSGGPSQLREKERLTQQACTAGSLQACEERYCLDGMNTQCRTRVMQTAKLSGANWYLRTQARQPDEATRYEIRCTWEGIRETRDIAVLCTARAGPQRCSDVTRAQQFERLDAAAMNSCARRP